MAGRLSFLLLHVAGFALWTAANTRLLPILKPFGPYPFQFLSFVTSLEAIFLSLFSLMSQNRSNRQAERRARLDLKINLRPERESTVALLMLRQLCRHHEVDVPVDSDLAKLLRRTEPKELLAALREKVPDL